MLTIVNDYVEGNPNDIYSQRENLKAMWCSWDAQAKKWKVPYGTKLVTLEVFIKTFNAQQQEKTKALWNQAMDTCNVKFAKKGTEDYDRVKEEFIKLVKNI